MASTGWKFEGPNAAPNGAHWYLELSEGKESAFGIHDMVKAEDYEAAPPETKRNIDQLVERGVLVPSEEE